MNIRTYAAIVTGITLILAVLLFFLWRASGEKDDTYHRDREQVLKHDAHMKRELSLRDSLILVLRSDRRLNDSILGLELGRRTSDLNASKRRERRSRPDTVVFTIVDTVYLQYDSLLAMNERRSDLDSLSFEKEIHLLGSKVDILGKENDYRLLKLDSAYTQLSDISGKLENRNKALTWSVFGNIALALLLILIL